MKTVFIVAGYTSPPNSHDEYVEMAKCYTREEAEALKLALDKTLDEIDLVRDTLHQKNPSCIFWDEVIKNSVLDHLPLWVRLVNWETNEWVKHTLVYEGTIGAEACVCMNCKDKFAVKIVGDNYVCGDCA